MDEDLKAQRPLSQAQRGRRRRFTAAQKLAILQEVDACPVGQQIELLHKYKIYASHLAQWRRERTAGVLSAPEQGSIIDERTQELARLERETARLTAELRKAELIINTQEKVFRLLGLSEFDLTTLAK